MASYRFSRLKSGQYTGVNHSSAYAACHNRKFEVRHEGHAVGTLGGGEFFGEEAILGDGRRNADVVALEPTTVFSMFGTRFREFEIDQPELAEEIVRTVQARHDAKRAVAD